MSHIPQEGPFISEDLKWLQKLASLTSNSILWYKWDWEMEGNILSCWDFPNVALIRTLGCINYNPILSMRQLGYLMEGQQEDKLIEGCILHDMRPEDPVMLWRIIRAWGRVLQKGKELGKINFITKEPYCQWVKERVQEIKLPFSVEIPIQPRTPETMHVPLEEANEINTIISRLEKENKEL